MKPSKHPRQNITIMGLKVIQKVCNYEHFIITVNTGLGIRAYAVVGFCIISFMFTQFAFAETGMKVSVNAFEGSTAISVTGHTDRSNNDVTIASQAPNGYIVSVSQVSPDANGDFGTYIQRNTQLWKQNGMYTIDVMQGPSPLYHMTFQVELVNGYTRATSLTQSTLEETPITVVTDRTSYIEGDIIAISGKVADLIAYTPVSITIIDPIGNIMAMASTFPYLDGSYSTAITAGGDFEGEYTINVLYGSQSRTASTTFYFGEAIIVACGPNEVIVLGKCVNAFVDEPSMDSDIISEIPSPLKQIKAGVPSDEVKCKDGLIPAIRTSNDLPICVKLDSLNKMIERGIVKG